MKNQSLKVSLIARSTSARLFLEVISPYLHRNIRWGKRDMEIKNEGTKVE